jgi:hypothetical protein
VTKRALWIASQVRRASLAAIVSLGSMGLCAAQDTNTRERVTQDTFRMMLGTIYTKVIPGFRDGRLNACMIEFSVLAQDWVYKQGAYIKVGGSFGLVSAEGRLGTALKVLLYDHEPGTMNFFPSATASAYFISGTGTTKDAMVGSFPSDIPGAIFVIFKLTPTFDIILQGLADGDVPIAVARRRGGTDIQIHIDTSVADTTPTEQRKRSNDATLAFANCAKDLIKSAAR